MGIVRPLSRMRICPRTCKPMLSNAPLRHSRNTTSKRTLQLTSKKNSTKNTAQHGIALSDATLDHTLPTRQNTLSTSILDRSRFSSSSLDRAVQTAKAEQLYPYNIAIIKNGNTRYVSLTTYKLHTRTSYYCYN